MKKKGFARAFTSLLSACLLLGAAPTVSAEEKDKPIVLLAASDFQAETEESSAANMNNIISAVKADGYTAIDGFLFAGDYDTEYDDKTEEIRFLKDTVKAEYAGLEDENMIFVQGNHDPAESAGLSKSGGNDTDDYGVFVIHEDDYMWYNDNETVIKNTAASLETYLKAKSEEGYSKPVFVVSHLALNYSMRTYNDGDGMYAKYLFDVLNQYGEAGLNIIFLFGHNHNNRYDDYIGGSAVYLTEGDTIYIAKPGEKTAVPDAYTLHFTYLNAGYVGTAYCLNNALTMTVFEITDGIVEIRRYCANGRYALKTQGAWASTINETAATYGASEDYLLTAYDSPDFVGNSASDADVTVVSSGITGLTAVKTTAARFPELQTAYACYALTAEGYTDGTTAYVKITPDESFDPAAPVFVRDTEANTITLCTVQNGKVIFSADTLGSYELYQTKPAELSAQKQTVYTAATQFADGKDFLIVSACMEGAEAYALQNKEGTALSYAPVEIKSGYGGLYITADDDSLKWHFVNDTDFGYASVIGDLQSVATKRYLIAANGTEFSTTENTEDDYTAWRIASTQFGMYTLKDNGTPDRYHVKFDDGFIVSAATDATRRVYLFEENTVEVNVTAYADNALGSVQIGAGADAVTGSKLYLTHSDGSVQAIDVTLSMLKDSEGNAVSAETDGVYSDLQVIYNGTPVCGGYTLFVGSDVRYPEPDTSKDVSAEASAGTSESVSAEESGAAEPGGRSLVWLWIVIALACAAIVFAVVKRKTNRT